MGMSKSNKLASSDIVTIAHTGDVFSSSDIGVADYQVLKDLQLSPSQVFDSFHDIPTPTPCRKTNLASQDSSLLLEHSSLLLDVEDFSFLTPSKIFDSFIGIPTPTPCRRSQVIPTPSSPPNESIGYPSLQDVEDLFNSNPHSSTPVHVHSSQDIPTSFSANESIGYPSLQVVEDLFSNSNLHSSTDSSTYTPVHVSNSSATPIISNSVDPSIASNGLKPTRTSLTSSINTSSKVACAAPGCTRLAGSKKCASRRTPRTTQTPRGVWGIFRFRLFLPVSDPRFHIGPSRSDSYTSSTPDPTQSNIHWSKPNTKISCRLIVFRRFNRDPGKYQGGCD
ncbi:hypothetical protein BDP27DRAFT_1430604 [Rhodocollybia butyracea]|uniref:Uncharacterized protein n=1 Tax=Rhodocollybia butyracea TaxID=206335 RepID=A0A9P5U004_9AGAR|nr:hypothetical protein BDP27DRAFT_1430604 [Rhodocollybia butyracea]